jgi:hypothetical protein
MPEGTLVMWDVRSADVNYNGEGFQAYRITGETGRPHRHRQLLAGTHGCMAA